MTKQRKQKRLIIILYNNLLSKLKYIVHFRLQQNNWLWSDWQQAT